jgi:hypothetical protein
MENIKKITLAELKKSLTEINKKERDLKAFIKQNNIIIKNKRNEIDSMNYERTQYIIEYIRQNPDRVKEDRILFNCIITGEIR